MRPIGNYFSLPSTACKKCLKSMSLAKINLNPEIKNLQEHLKYLIILLSSKFKPNLLKQTDKRQSMSSGFHKHIFAMIHIASVSIRFVCYCLWCVLGESPALIFVLSLITLVHVQMDFLRCVIIICLRQFVVMVILSQGRSSRDLRIPCRKFSFFIMQSHDDGTQKFSIIKILF